MRIQQQPAFVLHVRPWRETSLQLECLTRDHGRLGVLARGARRARARLSRALLEPFQPLMIDVSGGGELVTLTAAEATANALPLRGQALWSGLYVNELLVRLVARQDPHPGLLERYARTLASLAEGGDIGWTLRRLERDLLASLGYALELRHEADSREALDPAATYVYVPGSGPMPWRGQSGLRLRGADLLALAADHKPDAEGLVALRRLMRALIAEQLGDRGLRSWQLAASLRATPGRSD
ncbi:MAG TPA: DNA repair protein RecO [Rhodanobacteraceae bacterium]|nr:DNA repair protein RecO [Rhodanobacteraceae bacterium]